MNYLAIIVAIPVIIIVVLLLILYFEVLMFIHAFRNRRLTDGARLLWLIGMILIHPIVAIFYYFMEYRA